jgi:hypothetical protein
MIVELTHEQIMCLRAMRQATLRIEVNGPVLATPQDLAKLKARCEEFLAFPLIQALNSEGL